MPATYTQLIESVLTDVAKDGMERFSLKWFRQKSSTHHDIKARLGYLQLQDSPHGLSIYMSAGGRHEYTHRSIAVPIEAQPLSSTSSTYKTRSELLRENSKWNDEFLKAEIRLARADSVIDTEDGGDVGVVTGAPAAVTERIQHLVALSKNRKHQISLMHEAEQYRYNEALLNEDYERGIQEARDALLGGYRNSDAQGNVDDPSRGDQEE
ncbi:hypothetical protein EDB85DRAFT_1900757 [Lactarius pseudohatsudake]|nr:hypothetical protein EDB85DRAFT_1900757 [Lactarius pseudohatsudake]